MINRIILFTDNIGLPQLVKHIPADKIEAVVAASIRENTLVEEVVGTLGCPLIVQPDRSESAQFRELILELEPDLIFTHSYSMYIPPEILSIPTHGAINIHFSYLPKYRGANPIQWAIINGENYTGVTFHYMNANIDAGDIITQVKIPIYWNDTWIDVTQRCVRATDMLLEQEVPDIIKITNQRTIQNEIEATTYPRRKPEDGEIVWSMSAVDIYNKIRALVKPHPGAFYYDHDGKKEVIDEMKPYEWIKKMKMKWCGTS